MTQPDLFDRQSIGERFHSLAATPSQVSRGPSNEGAGGSAATFTRSGQSIVPPTPDELARARRDSGSDRADSFPKPADGKPLSMAPGCSWPSCGCADSYCQAWQEIDAIPPPMAVHGTGTAIARQCRDHGIQRAADHAGKEWQDRAVALVRWYAGFTPVFLTERVRDTAELRGLPYPPDKRSWGAVMMRAAREKIVRPDGYAPANSSNGSPKRRWASLVG